MSWEDNWSVTKTPSHNLHLTVIDEGCIESWLVNDCQNRRQLLLTSLSWNIFMFLTWIPRNRTISLCCTPCHQFLHEPMSPLKGRPKRCLLQTSDKKDCLTLQGLQEKKRDCKSWWIERKKRRRPWFLRFNNQGIKKKRLSSVLKKHTKTGVRTWFERMTLSWSWSEKRNEERRDKRHHLLPFLTLSFVNR